MGNDDMPPPDRRREALIVWIKLIGLLVVIAVVGFVMLEWRRSLPANLGH